MNASQFVRILPIYMPFSRNGFLFLRPILVLLTDIFMIKHGVGPEVCYNQPHFMGNFNLVTHMLQLCDSISLGTKILLCAR